MTPELGPIEERGVAPCLDQLLDMSGAVIDAELVALVRALEEPDVSQPGETAPYAIAAAQRGAERWQEQRHLRVELTRLRAHRTAPR